MKELNLIYQKRKKQLLPIAFAFASVFVFFRIVLPQWSDITDAQQLMTTKEKTVEAKNKTADLLGSLSQQNIDDDYALVTTALPIQKDIVLIFSELTDASEKVGVKLGGFTIKVGGVYNAIKNPTLSGEKSVNGIPFLNILITVSGKNENLRKFAEVLYKSMPIAEIKSVDISKVDARYNVNFYFKPVALKAPNADSTALAGLTPLQSSQLKELKSWKQKN